MSSCGNGSVWCTGVIDKDFWSLQTESLQHEEIVSAAVAFRTFLQSELSVLEKPQYGGKFCQGSSRVYQLCNKQPCPAGSLDFRALQCAEYNSKPFRGWFYKWKPYTKVEGHITAKAICLEDHRARVNTSFCGPRMKPLPETKLCNTNPCPAYSKKCFLPSQCSKTCGRGIKKREVYCKITGSPKVKILPDSMCSTDPKPESQQTCVLGRCPKNDRLQWVISSWSECSASCGPGLRQRELKCGEKSIHGKLVTFPQRRCRNIKKPNTNLEEPCNKGACPLPTLYSMVSGWYSSPWQQCTVTCGEGVQTRSVQCLRQGRPAAGCLPQQKPAVLRACNTSFCPVLVKRVLEQHETTLVQHVIDG
ncbi:hypothetical protein DUI87_34272 [Hirundo rustica rustica]|uniref:Uncharacterized protein n=1 Tax=Hirundo rustica rustica TaxID=333673 RepID=A0A3M0IMQ1_HIRRU|nr:hypothetical protein DUI87_34272 [Hirundo rustica rustica]